MQGPVTGPALMGQTIDQRVAALETRLATLEKLFLTSSDGSLTIKGPKISLQAPYVEVKAGNSIVMNSGASIEFKASAQLTLGTGGTANVKAAVIVLNGGTKPLARVGDAVQVVVAGQPATGVILAGNPIVTG